VLLSEEMAGSNDLLLPSVIEKLLTLYSRKWLKLIQHMIQDRADAEDVLQDSVLKMLLRNRSFGSLDQTTRYLNRVIKNTAIEAYHRRRRLCSRMACLGDGLNSIPSPEPKPCLEKEERKRVRMAKLLRRGLSGLPPKQFEALRLTDLEPTFVSLRNVGSQIGIPYSTLRDRRNLGRQNLRKFLLKCWQNDDSSAEASPWIKSTYC
jgi:RNA polymerase sigma-70 factor (ECF subfamily)